MAQPKCDSAHNRDERGVRLQQYDKYKKGKDYTETEAPEMEVLLSGMIDTLDKMKSRRGRPQKYPNVEDFIEKAKEYFQYIIDASNNGVHLIPDIEGLCAYMEIHRTQLNRWEAERDEAYREAISLVKNQIAAAKKQLALQGKIPPIVFATDFNNNHGYVQKQNYEMNIIPHSVLENKMSNEELLQKYTEGLPVDYIDAPEALPETIEEAVEEDG